QSLTRGRLLTLTAGGALAAGPAVRAMRAAASPKRGGTLVFAVETAPFGFDPPKWWSILEWCGIYAIFDRLLAISDDGKRIVPELSALPTISADGRTYTFRLRRGVKFHHGRELTADDAKFTLERIVDPKTASQGVSLYSGLPIVGYAAVAA